MSETHMCYEHECFFFVKTKVSKNLTTLVVVSGMKNRFVIPKKGSYV